jgi:hypothetical protein
MATIAFNGRLERAADTRFFMLSAVAMAAVVVAGFSLQLAAGRSSFHSPLLVHAHAVVFMGWVALYLTQNAFVATNNIALHRRLGWIGAGWIVLMLGLGLAVTAAMVRRGQVPFFFRPQHFLIFDPMTLFAFIGLTVAAIRLRRQSDWHRRLHFCGMSLLLGPAFGRLLPMPLLPPFAFEATFAAVLIFPVIGMVADRRRSGHVHPAWGWGVGAMVASLLLTEALTYSPVGDAIYAGVTAGSPGHSVPGTAFGEPPPGGRITGR